MTAGGQIDGIIHQAIAWPSPACWGMLTRLSIQLHACAGSVSSVVAGLDWVAANAQLPAIVTLSLGISKGSASQSLEQAVTSLVQDFNVTVIAASGELLCDVVSGFPSSGSTFGLSCCDHEPTLQLPTTDIMQCIAGCCAAVCHTAPANELHQAQETL